MPKIPMPRYIVLGGIAGPALFAALVVICGALRPDYSHVTQFISELGETGGDFAALMNYVGFMSSAALILSFAVALITIFPRTVLSIFGAVLVATFAVNMFAAGVFSCDVTCTPAVPTTHQQLHDLVSIIAFPSLILGALLWGLYFLQIPNWRRFGFYSLATAVLSVALLVAMVASTETRTGTGVLQRCLLGALFLWLALMAYRLWRESDLSESMGPVV